MASKRPKTEKEIYAEIKKLEKQLKVADQLQTYQTVFLCQVVIPNFNIKRRRTAEDYVKGTICKNNLIKLQKYIEMWKSIHPEI